MARSGFGRPAAIYARRLCSQFRAVREAHGAICSSGIDSRRDVQLTADGGVTIAGDINGNELEQRPKRARGRQQRRHSSASTARSTVRATSSSPPPATCIGGAARTSRTCNNSFVAAIAGHDIDGRRKAFRNRTRSISPRGARSSASRRLKAATSPPALSAGTIAVSGGITEFDHLSSPRAGAIQARAGDERAKRRWRPGPGGVASLSPTCRATATAGATGRRPSAMSPRSGSCRASEGTHQGGRSEPAMSTGPTRPRSKRSAAAGPSPTPPCRFRRLRRQVTSLDLVERTMAARAIFERAAKA